MQGTLGAAAASRLRALAQTIAAAERERVQLLVLVAEAQGYTVPDGATLGWDLAADPPAWRVVEDGA
jgi:hypothetical protein